MKRFILAGLFVMLGLVILGVVTADLMSGPDNPPAPRHAPSTNEASRGHGPSQQQQQMMQQQQSGGLAPYMSQGKSAQPAAPQLLPGMPVPLSSSVASPTMKPQPASQSPQVPALPQTDESTSRGK